MERSSAWCHQTYGCKQRSWDLGQVMGLRAAPGATLPHGLPASLWCPSPSARSTLESGKEETHAANLPGRGRGEQVSLEEPA